MKKPTVTLTIIKEKSGFSGHAKVKGRFIGTQARSFNELKMNVIEAIDLAFDGEDLNYRWEEINLILDLPSFFSYYKVINAKALSERIGMNQSLLAQYINGHKIPSKDQAKRILSGVRQIGKELSEVNFLL